jgi:hypothetical protein
LTPTWCATSVIQCLRFGLTRAQQAWAAQVVLKAKHTARKRKSELSVRFCTAGALALVGRLPPQCPHARIAVPASD